MLSFSLKNTIALAALVFAVGTSSAARAVERLEFDSKSAIIFAYFSVGDDSSPNASLRNQQFLEQADELTSGGYHVVPLPTIIDALATGKTLPPRTIAITFDGADRSIMDTAVPALIERDLPFTVFIPAARIGKAPYMDWDDLQSLKKTGLVHFGIHPSDYARMGGASDEDIRRQINNSLSIVRKKLDVRASLLAYPFGEYGSNFQKIAKDMGFKAAFGQNSGVAYAGDNLFALPRFTQTERYGDLERFRMTANALPLPVSDVSPADPFLTTLSPAIGFTVPEQLMGDLKNLSCFSSTNEKPVIEIVGKRRIEIRMDKEFSEDRPRINCTLPAPVGVDEEPRWRWFGTLYTLNANLLQETDDPDAKNPQRHAADSADDIRIE